MKSIQNERGFTLIEMLIVLLVISILLIITIPNVMKHQSGIQTKGCEAFVKMAVHNTPFTIVYFIGLIKVGQQISLYS